MVAENLTPKLIIDVNGRSTIVYVADKKIISNHRSGTPKIIRSATSSVDDGYGTIQGTKRGIKKLFEYQTDIVDKITEYLETHDRASASAACGMGKTVVAQELIRRHYDSNNVNNGIYVFITSGIRLTNQSREAFDDNGVIGKHDVFTVHSESNDFKIAKNRNRQIDSNDNGDQEAELVALTQFMTKQSNYPRVIFATYDSAEKIAKVQQMIGNDYQVEMILFDESHRLSTEYKFDPKIKVNIKEHEAEDNPEFSPNGKVPRVLFNSIAGSIQSDKRVFLTATPPFEEEYGNVYVETKARRSRGTKNTSAWVYDVNEEALTDRSNGEDNLAVDDIIHLDQMNQAVFGEMVASYDINYAINEAKVLTKVERIVVEVKSRVPYTPGSERPDFDKMKLDHNGASSPTGMYASSYAAITGTLEALADGDCESHNIIAFLPLNEASSDFANNWQQVAHSLAGDDGAPSLSDARSIVDQSDSYDGKTVRRARMKLLSEYANVAYATSKSRKDDKDIAYKYFDDKNQICRCGGKERDRWCACARVIANFNLFGQGIDIKQVDTVVQMNKNLLSDAAVTQSIGRAARNHRDKKSAQVILPILKFDTDETISSDTAINSELANRTLTGWSRMSRNVAKAAFERRQMEPVDYEPVRVIGANGIFVLSTTDMNRQVSGNPISSHILATGYKKIREGADTRYSKDPLINWSSMSQEERLPYYKVYAATLKSDPFIEMISSSKYPIYDQETANNANKIVESIYIRATQYDRESITQEEKLILFGEGKADRTFEKVGSNISAKAIVDPELQSIQSIAPKMAEAMRDMGISEEIVQKYASENNLYNKARLNRDAITARAADKAKAGGYRS